MVAPLEESVTPEICKLLVEDRVKMAKLVCRACADGDEPSSGDMGVYHTLGFFDKRPVRCPAEKIYESILCLPILK